MKLTEFDYDYNLFWCFPNSIPFYNLENDIYGKTFEVNGYYFDSIKMRKHMENLIGLFPDDNLNLI